MRMFQRKPLIYFWGKMLLFSQEIKSFLSDFLHFGLSTCIFLWQMVTSMMHTPAPAWPTTTWLLEMQNTSQVPQMGTKSCPMQPFLNFFSQSHASIFFFYVFRILWPFAGLVACLSVAYIFVKSNFVDFILMCLLPRSINKTKMWKAGILILLLAT